MKKKNVAAMLAAVMVVGSSMTSFAGTWEPAGTDWKYIQDDGSYITNGWQWIDGKSYYFDSNGIMLADTTTPDGYTVNADGQWVVNGVIQTQGETVSTANEQYPLAGMLEAFGLNDTGYTDPMIASSNGAWLPYTGKYQYINNGSSNLAAVAAVLAGTPYRNSDGVEIDPIQYIADANSLTYDQANQMIGMIRDFLNSFDWKNADDMTKAKKAAEFIENGASYGNLANHLGYIGSMLYYKQGICGNFAETYHLITRLMGMDCVIIANGHEWNYIKINNEWILYDGTLLSQYFSNIEAWRGLGLYQYTPFSPTKEAFAYLGIPYTW